MNNKWYCLPILVCAIITVVLAGAVTSPVFAMGSSMPPPEAGKQQTPTLGDKVSEEASGAVGASADSITQGIGGAIEKAGDQVTMSGRIRDAVGNADNVTCDPQKAIQTGKSISSAGKLIQSGGNVITVGDILSTSAGYLAEGQYVNAGIAGANGVGRAVVTSAAMAKGAVLGAPLGPPGMLIGGLIGAIASGWLYDKTAGEAAGYTQQKYTDYTTRQQLLRNTQRPAIPRGGSGSGCSGGCK